MKLTPFVKAASEESDLLKTGNRGCAYSFCLSASNCSEVTAFASAADDKHNADDVDGFVCSTDIRSFASAVISETARLVLAAIKLAS